MPTNTTSTRRVLLALTRTTPGLRRDGARLDARPVTMELGAVITADTHEPGQTGPSEGEQEAGDGPHAATAHPPIVAWYSLSAALRHSLRSTLPTTSRSHHSLWAANSTLGCEDRVAHPLPLDPSRDVGHAVVGIWPLVGCPAFGIAGAHQPVNLGVGETSPVVVQHRRVEHDATDQRPAEDQHQHEDHQ
jgi:hypothetical protein